MADDPYVDPYAEPNTAANAPAFAPSDPKVLGGQLDRYRGQISARDKEIGGIEQKQQLNVEQMQAVLDNAAKMIREKRAGGPGGGSNLPLMAMGAAMMGPGDFGTQLGRGFQAMVPQIQKQREFEGETEKQVADLELQKHKLGMLPLEQKMAYIKAMQQGDMATVRAIEAQMARSVAAANKPLTGTNAQWAAFEAEERAKNPNITQAELQQKWAQSRHVSADGSAAEQFKSFEEEERRLNPNITQAELQAKWAQSRHVAGGSDAAAYERFRQEQLKINPQVTEEELQTKWATAKHPTKGDDAVYAEFVKEERAKNPSITQGELMEKWTRAKTRSTDADRLLERYKAIPGNENKTVTDMMRDTEFIKHEGGAAGTATGKANVDAKLTLDTAVARHAEATSTIDKLMNHPGMANAFGPVGQLPAIPGTAKADFLAMEKHLLGQAFLSAYTSLKGAGAITEAEGLKASEAEVNLARTQSPAAYKAALTRYKQKLDTALEVAKAKSVGVNPAAEAEARRRQEAATAAGQGPSGQPVPHAPGSPSPSSQTGQQPSRYQDGQIADGPNGPMIFRNGRWTSHGG